MLPHHPPHQPYAIKKDSRRNNIRHWSKLPVSVQASIVGLVVKAENDKNDVGRGLKFQCIATANFFSTAQDFCGIAG